MDPITLTKLAFLYTLVAGMVFWKARLDGWQKEAPWILAIFWPLAVPLTAAFVTLLVWASGMGKK